MRTRFPTWYYRSKNECSAIFRSEWKVTMAVSYCRRLPLAIFFLFLCYNHAVHCLLPLVQLGHGGTKLNTQTKANFHILPYTYIRPLWYRELDDEDNEADPSMLKVKTRVPLGYDMKKAIQEQYTPEGSQPGDGVNRYLIRALTLNQYLILGLAVAISAVIIFTTNGPDSFNDLNNVLQWSGSTDIFDFDLTIERLLLGIGTAMVQLAISNYIENSDRRDFANINLSTITMCLSLFGRRSKPPPDFLPAPYRDGKRNFPTTSSVEAAKQSLVLSLITGFCEETVFRRLVPAMIVLLSGNDGSVLIPYFGQALLFGLGHAQPGSKLSENSIQVGLQVINGLGFGLLYVMSGGDLVPCMIGHATYDFVVFFKTWKDANDQLEYAESKALEPFTADVENEARRLIRATADPKIDPNLAYKIMKRMFYLFDIDKNETLSLSEVRKGVSYMAIERKVGEPPPQAVVDRLYTEVAPPGTTRLTFPDFVRLISISNGKKAVTSNA